MPRTGGGGNFGVVTAGVTNVVETTCTTTRTVRTTTATPDGGISYVTNGTVDRTITFVFGGTYTQSRELHLHSPLRDGNKIDISSEHYEEAFTYESGTYRLTCVSGYETQLANGDVRISRSELSCR